jgi:hypothetical protein
MIGQLKHSFRFRNFASKSKDELITLGFPAFTVEDFHDTVRLGKDMNLHSTIAYSKMYF